MLISLMNEHPCNHTPAVSVIMPVYNGERTLREAVDSILAQTFRDFELIICNDASTDETRSVLKSIEDERVRVIHNDVNLGPGLSRDRAIDIAVGTWLGFTDADDTWKPERLKALLLAVGRSENVMIFDDIIECHDTPLGLKPYRVIRGSYAFGGHGSDVVEVLLEHYIISNRLVMQPIMPLHFVKKHSIRHSGRRVHEDNEFFLKLLAHGLQLCYVPKPMYYYRITPGSMTGLTNRYIMIREVLENAINQFEHAPTVQAALCGIYKANTITRTMMRIKRGLNACEI